MRSESIDQLIDRLLKENRVNSLESELQKINPDELSGRDKESWHLHWGIAAFRRNDRPEAYQRFLRAYDAIPTSDEIAFSLGQEHEARGEPDKMVALFRMCKFPKVSAQHLLTASRYCYLWDLLEDAIHFLRPIRTAYFQLGIVDDTFLYLRRLPFVQQTLRYLLCFSVLRRDFTEIEQFVREGKQKLSEFSHEEFDLLSESYRKGSFDELIQYLDALARRTDLQFPTGYLRTQIACLRALSASDTGTTESTLSNIALEKNDFPWLADIALLHRARLAEVTGNLALEKHLIEQFFTRQPLLFEPDHAIAFGLVTYQEKLKKLYQRQRTISLRRIEP